MPVEPVSLERFLCIPDDERSGLELLNGQILDRTARPGVHEIVKSFVAERLHVFAFTERQWRVLPATEFLISRRSSLTPDVAIAKRCEIQIADQHMPFTMPPVLAVEVVSSEPAARLEEKIREYLDGGVVSVWTIYPRNREIFVRHADGAIRVFSGDQILEDDALPGFRVPVSAFFEDVNG